MDNPKYWFTLLAELGLFNIMLLLSGCWTVIASICGFSAVAVTYLITWTKNTLGFYEGKQINPTYTFLISSGISLFIFYLMMLLIKWRGTM